DSAPFVVWVFIFSSRRRHTRFSRDWSSDVCSSDLDGGDDRIGHDQQDEQDRPYELLEADRHFCSLEFRLIPKARSRNAAGRLAGLRDGLSLPGRPCKRRAFGPPIRPWNRRLPTQPIRYAASATASWQTGS